MNFDEFVKEIFTPENYKLSAFDASQITWRTCKEEVLKILKTKESFIGDGIKTAIKEIEKL